MGDGHLFGSFRAIAAFWYLRCKHMYVMIRRPDYRPDWMVNSLAWNFLLTGTFNATR